MLKVLIRYLYAFSTSSQTKISVCMQGMRGWCSVCECIPEQFFPSFYDSLICHQVLCDVTRHFNRPLGNLFRLRRQSSDTLKTDFISSSIILPTLFFGESTPLIIVLSFFSQFICTEHAVYISCSFWCTYKWESRLYLCFFLVAVRLGISK